MNKSRFIMLLGIIFPVSVMFADTGKPKRNQKDVENIISNKKTLLCYAVPALSPTPRLPDALPSDAKLTNEIYIIAAKGEYEPASFVLSAKKDLRNVQIEVSDLSSSSGLIKSKNIDIKVVKCWYQAGTAWYSYYGDKTRKVLTPELLLNDETLIKVDRENKENYIRLDYPQGSEYKKVSSPDLKAFNYTKEPVQDKKYLCPFSLEAGKNKQFWITVKVPETASKGRYKATLKLKTNGENIAEIFINLRVLPFSLPMPKTYYNLNRAFFTSISTWCALPVHLFKLCNQNRKIQDNELKTNLPLAEKRLSAEYKNLRSHNIYNMGNRVDYGVSRYGFSTKTINDLLKRELRLKKNAGFVMKPLFGGGWACEAYSGDLNRKGDFKPDPEKFKKYKKRIDMTFDFIEKELGHRDIYFSTWDEAHNKTLRALQPYWRYIKSKGGKMIATGGWGRTPEKGGLYLDIFRAPGSRPPNRENANEAHSFGLRVVSYAAPHTGPENPDASRRNHGLNLYKANYDGTYNYIYYSSGYSPGVSRTQENIWNDNEGSAERGFCMVYPTINGVIDTIAWEGFREGIDDIRYATKLKMTAEKAIKSKNLEAVTMARKALRWLETLDEKSDNLDTARLEMINYILEIEKLMKERI